MQKRFSIYLFLIIFILTGCTHTPKDDTSGTSVRDDEKKSESEKVKDVMETQMSDKERLLKFAKNFAEQKGYRVTMEATGGAAFSKMTLEFQSPATTRIIMTSSEGVMESIYVHDADRKENTSYISQNGSWLKQTYSESDVNFPDQLDEYKFDVSTFEDDLVKNSFVYKGTETCGNLTCYVYEVSEEGTLSKIYFDNQEFLLRRTIVQSKNESVDMMYEYGSIYIKIPTINVKEMPQVQQDGNFNSEDVEKMKELYGL